LDGINSKSLIVDLSADYRWDEKCKGPVTDHAFDCVTDK
jgi:hypothetical protein